MEYVLGWALLLGIILLIALVVRFAGGEREKPRASCGVGGCCGTGKATPR